jgi:antitoxin (DNA-binding transcriptional repressor) of toxin-antitoxin stability system
MSAARKDRVLNVTEFKVKCLALLDDIAEGGGTITITKRGKPLATVGPARQTAWKSPEGAWIGKLTLDDALLEADTSGLWDVLKPSPSERP